MVISSDNSLARSTHLDGNSFMKITSQSGSKFHDSLMSVQACTATRRHKDSQILSGSMRLLVFAVTASVASIDGIVLGLISLTQHRLPRTSLTYKSVFFPHQFM